MDDELHYCSAGQLQAMLHSGAISSTELLEHHIARIEALDGAINAVVVRRFDAARQEAKTADAMRRTQHTLGPLHGLPITVKEAFDVMGLPTTWGFRTHQNHIATRHAAMVQRLVDAGAIIMGKTNVPVALADWQSFNPVYGTTSNPWDLTRSPGGSSGGSAAALAAGFTPLELGSDIGASIRNPAHYCGVYGHKPTWGLLSMAGHELPGVVSADTLDIAVVGPMARTADDLRMTFEWLAQPLQQFGPMGWLPFEWPGHFTTPKGMRIAIMDDAAIAPVDDAIRHKLSELASFLSRQGATVLPSKKPVAEHESHACYMHLLRSATGAMLDDATWAQNRHLASQLDPQRDDTETRTYRASVMSHREWVMWDQRRMRLREQWAAFFQEVDLLIAPVATSLPIHHNHQGQRWERMVTVNGQPQPHTDSLFWAGYPGVVGLPATAFPLGLTAQGLPVGAQIIGAARHDLWTLGLAQWLQHHWQSFVPPPPWSAQQRPLKVTG